MKTLKLFIVLILIFTVVAFIPAKSQNYGDIVDSTLTKYNPKRKDYAIVVDYNLGIFSERLFVINIKTKEIVIQSKVSHAFNSGVIYPTSLSNITGTNKTCVGVFETENTKFGRFGYSMVINGLDHGINDNAKQRAIIFHSNKLMKTSWSNGCFATDENTNKKIIDLTNNGCLVIVLKNNR
jgi:hypothetical protein